MALEYNPAGYAQISVIRDAVSTKEKTICQSFIAGACELNKQPPRPPPPSH